MTYYREVYTNPVCIKIKQELIASVGNIYEENKHYTTKEQMWYINSKGYVHFIKGNNNILLANDGKLKW